jgi:hypothetical protein
MDSAAKHRGKSAATEFQDVAGRVECLDDFSCWLRIHRRIVDLARVGVDRVGEALAIDRELGVDAGFVAARILAVPGAVDVASDETVDSEAVVLVP